MASSGKFDMALDDIIVQNRANKRGAARGNGRGLNRNRFGGRGGRRAGSARLSRSFSPRIRNVPEGQWIHDRFNEDNDDRQQFGLRTAGGSLNATTVLMISNLEYGVSDSDIKELFGEFGPLRRAGVHYDKSGRSQGSADVVYERRSDAVRALKQYNGVPLDGRPMKIEIVGANASPSPIRSSFAGRRGVTRGNRAQRAGGGRGGGSGGRGGRGRTEKKPVTQEQLDADLDAYINKME